MRTLFFLAGVLLPALSFGQNSDLGNWLIVFGNKQINEKFNWHHEVQYRNYDAIGDLEQLLLRTGIGLNVNDEANVLLGYGFIRSENYAEDGEKVVVDENRIYQQLITRQKVRKLSIQHRYRFEQRFVEDDFRLRFRYFLAMNYPLWNLGEDGQKMYLSGYNEIFINTEDVIFDRNRVYGGLGYRLNDNIRFEVGYMNQLFSTSSRDQINLVAFINW